jgi:peroxin-5
MRIFARIPMTTLLHTLQALNLNPNAIHIWSYLRVAFSCMERFDLVTKCESRDVSAFKDEFSLFDL